MDNLLQKAAIGAAAVVGAKYLDAKLDIAHDVNLIKAAVMAKLKAKKMLSKDRCNFFYAFEDSAAIAPNNIYLAYEGKEWTYQEVKIQACRYGNYFLSQGVKPKDHVAMDFTNKPDFLFIWLGIICIGAIPALINYNLTSKPLLHCITVADAKLFIFDSEIASNVEGIKESLSEAGIRTICLVDPSDRTSANISWTECISPSTIASQSTVRPPDSLRSGPGLTDMAMLMFTSGTTGLPKAAIVSYNKLGSAPVMFTVWTHLKSTDRFYSCMPLYHATALVLGAAMIVRVQGTYCLGHKFSTTTFWDDVRRSRATCIQYVGEMCRYLLSAPPTPRDKDHTVRMVFGNGMRPDVWNRFRERFGIDTVAELYAATEGNGAQLNCSSGEYGSGCIGRLGILANLFTRSASVIVKMDPITEELERGPDGLCIRVGDGETGELLFLVDTSGEKDAFKAFQGYYKNATATNKKKAHDVLTKGDTFFRTGDVIKCQYDGWRRYTLFEDRIGDTFRWKGENVSTMEVAAVIGAYPGVDDANVYGIRLPNHDGRAGCVAISLHHMASLDFGDLAQHLKNVLPKYAVPLFIRITDAMTLTGNMKHQKHGMREEGIDPTKCKDKILWLNDGTYVDFTKEDWERMKGGQVKL